MPISILLVDDNPIFLKITTRFLQAGGEFVVVGTAYDGAHAVGQAQSLHPDVILLDLGMPGVSGLEAIPRLRALLPAVCIIVVTLLDTAGYRAAASAAGADDFISKAALDVELIPAIQRVACRRGSRLSDNLETEWTRGSDED